MKNAVVLLLLSFLQLSAHGQVVAIADSEQNVLYVGIDNPLTIAVPGISPDLIVVSTNNGTISKDEHLSKGHYDVWPQHPGSATIYIKEITPTPRGKVILDSIRFVVRRIASPTPMLCGRTNGKIEKSLLCVQIAPYAILDGFDFDAKFQILAFTTIVIRNNDVIFSKRVVDYKGARFDTETKDFFKTVRDNDEVIIKDVIVTAPNECRQQLSRIIDLWVVDNATRH